MKLYTYVPKESDVLKSGVLSVSKLPEELLKYGKRLGTNDSAKISEWLEKTFPGRRCAVSVLTEPVEWKGNDPMLKEWVEQKKLVAIDFDELLKKGLIASIWCKNGAKADGTDEKIFQITSNEIDFSPLPWHLCSKEKGLFFSVIRHYFLVMKGGVIPPKYIKEV